SRSTRGRARPAPEPRLKLGPPSCPQLIPGLAVTETGRSPGGAGTQLASLTIGRQMSMKPKIRGVAAVMVFTAVCRADGAPRATATASDCRAQLAARGARVVDWPVRPVRLDGQHVCSVSGGVRLLRTRARIHYSRVPRVSCAFAGRLMRFEEIVQEE